MTVVYTNSLRLIFQALGNQCACPGEFLCSFVFDVFQALVDQCMCPRQFVYIPKVTFLDCSLPLNIIYMV